MAEYGINKVLLAVLLLIVVVVCVYVVIKILGIDIGIPMPPRDPLGEAIICVYYRCVKGYHFVNQIKWRFINCTCSGNWDENGDGKICGDESKRHPIEFETNESLSFNRSDVFYTRVLGKCPHKRIFGGCNAVDNCFVASDSNYPCNAYLGFVHLDGRKTKVIKSEKCTFSRGSINVVLEGSLESGKYYAWSESFYFLKYYLGEGYIICSEHPCCRDCNPDRCSGTFICENGICENGNWISGVCSQNEDCLISGYCEEKCRYEIGKPAFSSCVCKNGKCEAECKPEEIPDTIPEIRDSWTESIEHWSSAGELNLDSSDKQAGSFSVHSNTIWMDFSFYDALGEKYVYLPDFKKLHFWFKADKSKKIYVIFDEDWFQPWDVECEVTVSDTWKKYEIDLSSCSWNTQQPSITGVMFSAMDEIIDMKIDDLYLCKNC